ncbi:permease-like cell division protein FtsX [Actinoplanes sp. NPDC051859]|uniref:permease-like cell division protein FtsX n=1 Tax=Actinoplanes sp. NPDC051859 TaxID=3363909 RepID=UPI0037B3E542
MTNSVARPVMKRASPSDTGRTAMEQDLRDLFERALDDEPARPPGDPARLAMAQGRRIRRRRTLVMGGSGVLAVIAAAVVAGNVTSPLAGRPPAQSTAAASPAPSTPAMPSKPACPLPADDRPVEVAIFLTDKIAEVQFSRIRAILDASPLEWDMRIESYEQADPQPGRLLVDLPDLTASPDSLPESFRVMLTTSAAYPEFAAKFEDLGGRTALVGRTCPGAGE